MKTTDRLALNIEVKGQLKFTSLRVGLGFYHLIMDWAPLWNFDERALAFLHEKDGGRQVVLGLEAQLQLRVAAHLYTYCQLKPQLLFMTYIFFIYNSILKGEEFEP